MFEEGLDCDGAKAACEEKEEDVESVGKGWSSIDLKGYQKKKTGCEGQVWTSQANLYGALVDHNLIKI